MWIKRFNRGPAGTGQQNRGNSISSDNIGNVYVSGASMLNNTSSRKFCALKYSNNGDLLWAIIDSNNLTGQSTFMDIDTKSNIYITGAVAITGGLYDYRIVKYDSSGTWKWTNSTDEGDYPWGIKGNKAGNIFVSGEGGINMLTVKYSEPLAISNNSNEIPFHYQLQQNFPNPFNPSTSIKYGLPYACSVKISIYNILGQKVTELVNEFKEAGYYQARFDGTNLASGIYIYRIEAGGFVESKKMLLVK